MHGLYVLLACLLSCLLLSAAAPCETAAETNQVTNLDIQAEPGGFLFDDTWMYTGYTYGGGTFAIPKESNSYELTDQFREAGIVLLIGNDDFCLQLRKFDPEVLSYEQFKEIIQAEPTAETRITERNGKEVFIYRNTDPNPYGELYGIAVTGLDGNTYKVSIFTGDSEAYGEDDPVWKIAEIIGQSFTIRDFSEWGIPTAPDE